MYTIRKETNISADANTVYNMLTDIENYATWNPWNIRGKGIPAVGGPLVEITCKLGKKTLEVKHKILDMTPNKSFVWCDTGFFTWLTMGKRSRYLTPTADGVHYRVELQLTGPLVPLTRLLYQKQLIAGMEQETAALKRCSQISFKEQYS